MQANAVTQVLIWSRWLRLSHWGLTLSTIGLLASGWLLGADPVIALEARDYHYIFAALLLPALVLRLYLLLFGKGTDHLSDCEPNRHRLEQAVEVLRFYLTLGKTPLPKWFSHNPLWGPLYLVLFFFLLVSALSGILLLKELTYLAGISMHDLHQIGYYAILVFTLLHIPAAFSHDLSGQSADISAMVNGHRIFHVQTGNQATEQSSHSVALQDLLKTRK
jgi:Ni/Fe-hydrogenase 1 B-type cytochrome subunit